MHSAVMNSNTMNIHLERKIITTNSDSEGLAAPHHELFPTDSKLIKVKNMNIESKGTQKSVRGGFLSLYGEFIITSRTHAHILKKSEPCSLM